jgi:hypothetical protein
MEVPRFSQARPSAYAIANARHMLEWLALSTDSAKDTHVLAGGDSIAISTSFPHKTGGFCVVSHNSADEIADLIRILQPQTGHETLEKQRVRLSTLTEDPQLLAQSLPVDTDAADPLLPELPRSRRPFKVGVTALVRARHAQQAEAPALADPDEDDPGEMETARQKRLPLPLTRPRQIADLPALPAFMREAAGGPRGILRGVAAHKALCLLRYEPLRACSGTQELRQEILMQLRGFQKIRLFTEEELRLLDDHALATFFESEWGRDALHARIVKRELGFVLALPEEDGMLVQGVIDLCYLNGFCSIIRLTAYRPPKRSGRCTGRRPPFTAARLRKSQKSPSEASRCTR